VKHGTLGGDSKKYVKRVSVGWEKIDGCRVAIEDKEGHCEAEQEPSSASC